MDGFTQKLRLIYTKMFNEDIDKFTEALIDHQKYKSDKNKSNSKFDNKKTDDNKSNNNKSDNNKSKKEIEEDSRKQFFLNRKTVLRRWLLKEISCTPDFQKSFKNYKLSSYQFKGKPLFTLNDFRKNGNIEEFDDKIEHFLHNRNRVQIKTDYVYIYTFCEVKKKIIYYKIINWEKCDDHNTVITVESDNCIYEGTFSLSDENNIFITLCIDTITLYFLFHDSNDVSCPYIVGTSMGYLPHDNKVPRSQKVVFAKERIDKTVFDLEFILNETESISAIENRLNLHFQDVKVTHFVKYANKFKQYLNFFTRLSKEKYKERFYYRLAFREFYALQNLFQRVSKKETYFVYDYQRALCELIDTVEEIKSIPLYMVMELNDKSIFLELSQKNLEIKRRFLNLYSRVNITTTTIFVVEDRDNLSVLVQHLLEEFLEKNIEIYLVNRNDIINEVNSLDFIFIDLKDKRDFVLADPIRDSKDVYKLFTNDINMDEYKIDYQRFLRKSIKIKNSN